MPGRLSQVNSCILLLLFFVAMIITSLTQSALLPDASAAAQGDGTIVYGEGMVATPRSRTWTQASTSWGTEASNQAAAATIRHVATKASPKKDEVITGVQTTGGVLYIQRWNGSVWSNEWNVTVGNGTLPRFDIAYEKNSGEVIVVYGGNVATTNELRYRVWNGSSWTGEINLDAIRTSGTIHAVRLEAHAGTLNNDIALAWGDSNLDLSANYWNGAANAWTAEPAATLSTGLSVVGTATALTTWSFDVALESSTGDMLVAWGNNAVQDVAYVTRGADAGGTWGAATTNTAALEEPTDLDLASDPNSDYIAYANITDNTAGADASVWTGSTWNAFSNFDATSGTVAAGTKNISISWLRNGVQDRAVVVYEDAATSAGLDWLFYNKNTNAWSATQADFTTAPAPATDIKSQRQMSNPFNASQLMVVAIDSASDLLAKRLTFDGTNFTWSSSEPSGVALEATASSITGFAADFTYAQFVSGPLTVDIVDSTGASVLSPSVNMSTANVALNCQTVTGVFGTSSQKIRINNATAAPGWTLAIAATAGNTALWNSGGNQYDYNDSSGAPSGCADGGDSDAHGGQLTIDPAAGTLTPQNSCTNSGVSLGASTAFTQGVLDSLTLASASSGALNACYWDLTSVSAAQALPPEKPAGSYIINLTLTATSN